MTSLRNFLHLPIAGLIDLPNPTYVLKILQNSYVRTVLVVGSKQRLIKYPVPLTEKPLPQKVQKDMLGHWLSKI